MSRNYWRSLDEPADRGRTNEFPPGATELDGATRRDFLKLLSGTAALAGSIGLGGCFRNPPDKILPYARQPDEIVPGNSLHYATTLTLDGYGTGVVVASREGRPLKVEGNPSHPASLGATGAFEQGAIYHLFDPQRARTLRHGRQSIATGTFFAEMAKKGAELEKERGRRLRFLVEPSGSPAEATLRVRIMERFPEARFYAFAAAGNDAGYEGTKLLFGRALETRLDFDRARVIVSLDADFLGHGPFRLRYARDFANHRVPDRELNRLYMAEAGFSITGQGADHRLRVRASEVQELAAALLSVVTADAMQPGNKFATHPWVKAAAADLKRRPESSLVVVGARQPPAVHALAAAINAKLGTAAVSYSQPVLGDTTSSAAGLQPLVDEIRAGQVDTLVITAYNPSYSTPGDLELARWIAKVPNAIYRGLFQDETARSASWFVPATHELEAWGDARALDGTISLQQPLIAPLWNGVTTLEVLASLLGTGVRGPYRLLREHWQLQAKAAPGGFERWWERSVQLGVLEGSAFSPEAVTADLAKLPSVLAAAPRPRGEAGKEGGLEINFVPDPKIYDGRYADNAWLQELPAPISKLTWSNALEVSPKTAKRLGLATEDAVSVAVGGKSVRSTVLVLPGHADDSLTLALGYGREGAEMIARELGANANSLRTAAAPFFALGATVTRTGLKSPLSITQAHWTMEGRPAALEVDAAEVARRHLPILDEHKTELPTLYPPHPYDGFKWAMSIDMSRCTGCNACIIACESENNILVVGADQVRRGREMQWLRVDRYFEGPIDDPNVVMQPMACVHCENAPCEYVCPVNATVHSDEGLNEMVYNRCVGTRYCSDNCPYKVRRFNFLNYHDNLQGTEEMAMNPDVSVRSRGVMEKCTYCVQRIERWRIDNRVAGKGVADYKDGEFTSACAQVCPSQAIVFGSLHDPQSQVSKLHEDPRSYQVLHSLGTRPRTAHLARVRNRNPELG
jgi:molybdopterin-containing oxidoreductase family iron-sulfur binding subunit